RDHGRNLFSSPRAPRHGRPLATGVRHCRRGARSVRRRARLHLGPLGPPDARGKRLRAAPGEGTSVSLLPGGESRTRRRQRARPHSRRDLPGLGRADVRPTGVRPRAEPRGARAHAAAPRRAAQGEAMIIGSLVALAAAAADVVLRLGNRAARGIWLAALGVTVIGTALAPARAAHRPMVAVAGAASAVPASHTMSLPDRIARSVEIVRQAGTSIVNGALAWMPGSRAARLDRWLAAAWIVASIAEIAMLLAVHQLFRTARRACPVSTRDDTRVRLAPHTGPAVLGLAAAEIVVSAWFVGRSRAEQHVALDHEREHVRTRDPLVLAAGFGAAALMPWNPAVWWMLARLRLAVELDCDARVLRRGVTARSYGALLIDLAGRSAAGARIPVLGLTLTHLERRLIAMTPHRRPFHLPAAACSPRRPWLRWSSPATLRCRRRPSARKPAGRRRSLHRCPTRSSFVSTD